ncbi:MAG: DAK2 domain-containing protein [Ruminococcaceae bacterium]|nr:DAK2 domain-containing protein [Oscillospiraceae bacterium]
MRTINSELLAIMLESSANNLKNNKKAINDLNIFPVPDGDTGTNMSMTFGGALSSIEGNNGNCGEKVAALSKAALRNARGNSGVILSQIIRGLSNGVGKAEELSVVVIKEAAVMARKSAYDAVMKPTEGTILTVVRQIAEYAEKNYKKFDDADEFFYALVKRGNESLASTPDMLPVLKQAGVVDAGGKGVMVLLEGMEYALKNGVSIASDEADTASSTVVKAETDVDIKFMYCTEFIINKSSNKSADGFSAAIKNKGDCMLVIDDDDIVKVHIHTNHPGSVIEEAIKLGELTNLKIDNMKYQHEENALEEAETEKAEEKPQTPPEKYGFVAVSAGEGLTDVFKSLGANEIVEGGQTMNPSTQDILDAVEKVNAENVFILPNNKNIILAAEQVDALTEKNVFVLPTKTVPAGISAMMGFDGEAEPQDNVDNMMEMANGVTCGQLTFAARDTEVDGVEIHEGDIMGLSPKGIEIVGDDLKECAKELVDTIVTDESAVISVYYGADVSEEDANVLLSELEEKYSDLDVALYYGGQPIYYYIISVE